MRWKSSDYAGWGRVLRASGEVARPERAAAVAQATADTPSPAIGMRRSYGDACLNDGGRVIDMTRLDRVLDFDATTGEIHVEAGAMIGELLATFSPRGWLPPVMPGTGFATVGGGICMDVHGKNHHGAGSLGQHVTEITLMTGDGPRTITPKDDAPLFKATVGGLGQTGPILSARFRLLKAKGDVMVVTERRVQDWDEFLHLLDASDATYSVGWIDATARGLSLGRGILEEAETGGGLVRPAKRGRKVPMDAPGLTLSPPVVRAFNAAYWRRVPASGRTLVKPVDDFFFPLDKIHDWNRLYGKRGFHQFQCVVPLAEADRLRGILEKVANSGLASPLAVLKRTGPGRAGFLSFPMEGYTLAVDFPNRTGAERLIRDLIRMAAEAGGRIYFAKDSVASPEAVRGMYSEQGQWLDEVERIDPGAAFATDLVRRLKLRERT
ncbi:FAD-binding oxidoreductase [Silicimonas algicola]|uniref:Decaprenylphospho-beta-D-ribofuranose 2-oxidase n=1 Tax=Silicimonas algicola TaxID=1826607 RepID=A0A316GD45_9RHOB|nr:FAD-binding oxidoreductase [Silicimonas algicola]AZQ66173.1 FAD-binding oxidoreductase [Silicimonas algicola]PWK58483.1 decaprenylphospho-beta-D-ribofuranose 2-oxidase [Silicimonas algicola]